MKNKDVLKENATADIGLQDKKADDSKHLAPDSDPSFQKHYNKELRVSQDEVPIVLNELNDT
jgi:hypothetical protein